MAPLSKKPCRINTAAILSITFLRFRLLTSAEIKDTLDEETIVIFFGDHLPTLGIEESEIATHDLYKTKYLTWNNFGMSKDDMDLTAYQLVPEYLDRMGIHEGVMINYNQDRMEKDIPTNSEEYQEGLKLLQYDILYGKQYAYKDKFGEEKNVLNSGKEFNWSISFGLTINHSIIVNLDRLD